VYVINLVMCEQVLMVNNYEQNIENLTKKLKNIAGLLEQRV